MTEEREPVIIYEVCCRSCGHEEDIVLRPDDAAPPCSSCSSTDTFRAVSCNGFKLSHKMGDVCGWALSNYSNEKHIDLGDAEGSKAQRWGKVKN